MYILEVFWHALERMALFSGIPLLISAPAARCPFA